MDIIKEANKTYLENFPAQSYFGRCIFLSWYCDLGTCKFCFRSTTKHQIKHAQHAKRSAASIFTDAIIGKNLGWHIEFLTGGYRIFSFEEMLEIIRGVSEIYNRKIWINLGVLDEEQMDRIKPYVEGVCASIETVEKELHSDVCPDKPIEPYSEMLKLAKKKGFKTSMTIVMGLGESKDRAEELFNFIEEHELDQITFYALKPVKGTPYTKSPELEDYAWWIANTRVRFPKLVIMAGLTPKKPDYAEMILRAGANGITKFPVVKRFASDDSHLIEEMAKKAGRPLDGSLVEMPDVDWMAEVDKLSFDDRLKAQIKDKLRDYIRKMTENSKKYKYEHN